MSVNYIVLIKAEDNAVVNVKCLVSVLMQTVKFIRLSLRINTQIPPCASLI